jgi:uncharacterized protein (TIGR02678 family)
VSPLAVDEISPLELDSYRDAARAILGSHFVTRGYPAKNALTLVRRWSGELRRDLLAAFGYRLDVGETVARLHTTRDDIDPGFPARTAGGRVFDRQRYAFLCLAIAVLGRGGSQITLSELAGRVAAQATRIDGLALDTETRADRGAFVDAVAWLTERRALALADGDALGWVADHDTGEALYDVDRAVLVALFPLPQSGASSPDLAAFLHGGTPPSPHDAARRVRRLLVENAVVYGDWLPAAEAHALSDPEVARQVQAITGLAVERRGEGVALIDPRGHFTDTRFPGVGTIAQAALLLAVEIAERVTGPDGVALTRLPASGAPHARLRAELAAAQPGAEGGCGAEPESSTRARYPLMEDSWLAETAAQLAERYGKGFAARWQADPAGLAAEALALLEAVSLVRRVPGGALALPALARFRDATVAVRARDGSMLDLFSF